MTFLTVFSVIIILGVVIYAASNLYVLKSAEPYIMASEDASSLDADCILVLGCKANGGTALKPEYSSAFPAHPKSCS